MSYSIENALFQWREGERRLASAPEDKRADLDRALFRVVDELRRRFGSTFTIEELADFYGQEIDPLSDVAQRHVQGSESTWVVDAAFAQYAREASNYAGGRAREDMRRRRAREGDRDAGPRTSG